MNVEFRSVPFSAVEADALLLLHFEDAESPAHEWFGELAASGESKGKLPPSAWLPPAPAPPRLLRPPSFGNSPAPPCAP